ncbi:hypothetical protein [Sporomusa acidovorans]|uniref:Uncharacterized protein n=1 Tax=Sporomusa acidovorans (strain ATCC 49682 / DSM 3132 / Mol) TaxID=1123286 RepID=A0ABZ3J4N4_SPOA4|nr:hypothetical protein [Sporomusa acidovorans]OZC15580.1 hypothetical protein SPACI_48840 [Sporomusa acidovorans DSM 3132]SDE18820.1 hypothetical protein SAMN04488499_1009113 [Sporomusa acidovorans]
MQKLLLVIACCSIVWNYDIPQRYRSYEKGQVLCGRRLIRLALLKMARRVGSKVARRLTLGLIFLTWIILSCYFIAISAAFPTIGLTVVALLAAILGTIALWQDMAGAYRNFTEWCYNQEDSIILVTKGCWEIILAGLIFINLFLDK